MTKPKFKITYGTLSAANPELHQAFDLAVEQAKAKFGTNYPMLINGQERFADQTFEDRSPINTGWLMGTFQKGTKDHAKEALTARARPGRPGRARPGRNASRCCARPPT